MEIVRFDENGGHNQRRKRRRSTKYKHEYSDSSAESDSCDYFHDGDEGKATARRHHAKTRQERDKNRRTEVRDNSRKEEDDDRSVSDDSLEVIVVKKSLEKKCEKVVSGRRSKTPRECTKETKVTKLHTRSSTKTSKSGKSKAPDDDTSAADREDRSPSKEEDEPSKTLAEEARDDEERVRSRYQRDVTDSTSQETVERVVVTAMVHKNQAPDTPKSTLEAARETKLDGDLKEKDGTSRDASDENEILSRKTDVADVVEERPPQTAQGSSKSGDEIRDEDEKPETTISSGTEDARKAETTDDKLQGKNLKITKYKNSLLNKIN